MQTLEAIHTRRSIRAFTPDPIDEDTLGKLVSAAAAAPSGGNAQNWVFIAIHDPKRIASIKAIAPGIIGTPTAIIVLCHDTRHRPVHSEANTDKMIMFDLGAAMQNILLAANELGFGGCPIGSFHVGGLRILLALPESVSPSLLVALGKPKFRPNILRKRPLSEIYYQEIYEDRDE